MPPAENGVLSSTEPGRPGAGRAQPGGTEPSDAELIERSRREPDVFATIFDRHADQILRYAHTRLGPDLAEDVTAETFLAAFRRRDSYDLARADARPWLYGITIRLSASTGGPKAGTGACSRRSRPMGGTTMRATAAPTGSPPSNSGRA